MSVSFNPKSGNNQAPQEKKNVGMPVGTEIIMSLDKFMFDKRDQNCKLCRNGFRSTLPKQVDGRIYNVNVVCSCVPYFLTNDGHGTGIVVYKGRKEDWVKGKRPESEIQNELIRQGATQAALMTGREQDAAANADPRSQKAINAKAKRNAEKPAQKVMQQDKQGHWIFTDLKTGKKMGLTVSDTSNPVVKEEAETPAQAQPAAQTQPQTQPQGKPTAKGLRPETDEEFLARTTGQAPDQTDPTFLSKVEADKIVAQQEASAKTAPAAPATTSAPQPPSNSPALTQPPANTVKRGRGRPKGSTKKTA